jgi:hypothetical protein
MRLFSNRKSVSRERIIGISLADILLQAVFLLFIALIIGYEDPQNLILIKEYQEFGKDLCTKKNTDSLTQCKEQVIKDDQYAEVGRKLCTGKLQDSEKCIKHYLDAVEANNKSKGNLVACMHISTTLDETYPAAVFKIYSKDVIQFIKFTQEYKNYLTEHNDQTRLDKVNAISENYKFSPDAIESTFGFIRQDDCFHKPSFISGTSNLSQAEWVQAIRSVSSSFKNSK